MFRPQGLLFRSNTTLPDKDIYRSEVVLIKRAIRTIDGFHMPSAHAESKEQGYGRISQYLNVLIHFLHLAILMLVFAVL